MWSGKISLAIVRVSTSPSRSDAAAQVGERSGFTGQRLELRPGRLAGRCGGRRRVWLDLHRGQRVREPSQTLRELWSWQRSMTGSWNTSVTARRSAWRRRSLPNRRVASGPTLPQPDQDSPTTIASRSRPLTSAQRVLVPSMVIAKRDHTALLGHPDAVHHERHQVRPGQVLGQRLGQGVLGAGHEPARHRPTWRCPSPICSTSVPTGSSPAWSRRVDSLASIPFHRELVEAGRDRRNAS